MEKKEKEPQARTPEQQYADLLAQYGHTIRQIDSLVMKRNQIDAQLKEIEMKK